MRAAFSVSFPSRNSFASSRFPTSGATVDHVPPLPRRSLSSSHTRGVGARSGRLRRRLVEADGADHRGRRAGRPRGRFRAPRVCPAAIRAWSSFRPIEQFRPDYVFLTPDKYAFDFIVVIAPPGAACRARRSTSSTLRRCEHRATLPDSTCSAASSASRRSTHVAGAAPRCCPACRTTAFTGCSAMRRSVCSFSAGTRS